VSFKDQYLPFGVPGYPCASVPRTKTRINVSSGGGERRIQEWEHPLHRFILPEAAGRDWSVVEDLKKHWLVMSGPAYSWPFVDPLDFASTDLTKPNVTPTLSATDQLIGTGTGFTDTFQLVKTYTAGAHTYSRTIHLPVLATVVVSVNGVTIDPANYEVTRPGGVVTFDTPPANGHAVRAGFLFDCEVRFESDDALESILRTYQVGGFADITLIEVRPC
jgi:uncharacterized protein (TIGR02217 family)